MTTDRLPMNQDLIEAKFAGLGVSRIAVTALIALLSVLEGCAQPAFDRREVFMDSRAEVVVAVEREEPVVQAMGWPWVDTGSRLARMAEAGGAISAIADELP